MSSRVESTFSSHVSHAIPTNTLHVRYILRWYSRWVTRQEEQEEARWRIRWYIAPLVDAHNIESKRRKCKLADGGFQEAGGGIGKGAKRSAKPAGRCEAMTPQLCLRQWRRSVIRHTGMLCARHYAMREAYLPWRNSMTGWLSVLCVTTKPKHYPSCDNLVKMDEDWQKFVRTSMIIANPF